METHAVDARARIPRRLVAESKSEAFLIELNSQVATLLVGPGGGAPRRAREGDRPQRSRVKGRQRAPHDHFVVLSEGKLAEEERRGAPVEQGQELEVELEEAHLHAETDAIARLDGYVITVAGARAASGRRSRSGSRTSARRPRAPSSPRRTARSPEDAKRSRAARHAWGPRAQEEDDRGVAEAPGRRAESPRRKRQPRRGRAEGQEEEEDEAGHAGWARTQAQAGRILTRSGPGEPARLALWHENDSYAIIAVGGKQYRVREGERLLVDRLPLDEGRRSIPTSSCWAATASRSSATSSRASR